MKYGITPTPHHPVIVQAVFLDKRSGKENGRKAYAFLLLNDEKQIVARPYVSRNLREVTAFFLKHKTEAALARVTFDPPEGIDDPDGKHPRRYEALELSDLYYVSTTLRQS